MLRSATNYLVILALFATGALAQSVVQETPFAATTSTPTLTFTPTTTPTAGNAQAVCMVTPNDAVFTPPDGTWTLAGRLNSSTIGNAITIYTHVVPSSPASSYQFTYSTNVSGMTPSGVMWEASGVNTSNLVNNKAFNETTNSGSGSATVTPTAAGTLALSCATHINTGGVSVNSPWVYETRAAHSYDPTEPAYYPVSNTTGNTNPISVTWNTYDQDELVGIVLLNPASSGGGGTSSGQVKSPDNVTIFKSSSTTTGYVTSATFTRTPVVGALQIVGVNHDATVPFSAPDGTWTHLTNGKDNSNSGIDVWWRIVPSNPASTYTFSGTASGWVSGSMVEYDSGFNPSNPLQGIVFGSGTDANGWVTAGPMTPTTRGEAGLSFFGHVNNGGIGPSTGWNQDATAGSDYQALGTADYSSTNTGSNTNPISVQWHTNDSDGIAALILINPASVPALPIVITGCDTVTAGQTCTLTANQSVTWTLYGDGSTSPSTGTTTTVTAPTGTFVAAHQRGGCQVAPYDSIWNTRIDGLPAASSSPASAWVSTMQTDLTNNNAPFSFELMSTLDIADSNTPTFNHTFNYTSELNTVNWPQPARPDNEREDGTLDYSTGQDHHWVVVRKDNCNFYETYNDRHPGSDGTTAASGYMYSGQNYATPTHSTDAAGLPITAFTITRDDIQNGLNHPVRFTLRQAFNLNNNNIALWPAGSPNGTLYSPTQPAGFYNGCIVGYNTAASDYYTNPGGGGGYEIGTTCPQMGSMFRLKASWLSANLANYSTYAQHILTGLAHYGMIDADNSWINLALETDADVYQDPTALAAIKELSGVITLNNIEAVDVSGLEDSSSTTAIKYNNGLVTPAHYMYVTASNGGASTTVGKHIAEVPITLGIAVPDYGNWKDAHVFAIMAGTYQTGGGWNFGQYVYANGTTNSAVTWTLGSGGVGTVSSNGYYQPPTSVANPTRVVINGVSQADSSATITLIAYVLPQGTSPTNSIRIASKSGGCSTTTSPSCTNTWLDMATVPQYQGGTYTNGCDNGSYWTSNAGIWACTQQGFGQDFEFGVYIVPPGLYDVTYYYNNDFCSGTWNLGSVDTNLAAFGYLALTGNNAIGALWDPGLDNGYLCRGTYSKTIPATVGSNGVLFTAMRAWQQLNGVGELEPRQTFAGVSIVPDASSPKWALDTSQVSTVKAGQTAIIVLQDWGTGQRNPTYSLACGGQANCGTLSAGYFGTEVYTAPTTAPTVTFPVTITATNGTYTATATLQVVGTQFQAAIAQ